MFDKYQLAAEQYMEGTISDERILDFSPLYLYVNIFAGKYFENPVGFILRLHIVLISLSVVLLFLLLKSFFNMTLSILGAFAFMINKSVILYTRALEPEPLLIFFSLGFLYFAVRSGRFTPALSGLFLGLCVLSRSNFLPVALVIPFYFIIKYKEKRQWIRKTVIFAIPLFAAVAFLAVRNSGLADSFTIFQMNPGQVFFEGNNPNSWGESAIYPPLVHDFAIQFPDQSDFQHVAYRYFPRRIKNEKLTLNEVNWFWTQKGLNFIVDYPLHFFKRLLTKTNFVFHNYRRHDLGSVFWNDQNYLKKLPTIPFALISAMALLGMLLSVKKWRERLVIYAVLFLQMAVMILLYVSDRQRVAIVSLMVFFAVDFLDWLVSNRKKKNVLLGLVVLLIFPFLYFENNLIKDEQYLWHRYSLSNGSMRQAVQERKNGNLELAAQQNALAIAYTPWLIENKRLSGLTFKDKSIEERALEISASFGERHPSALFDLAVIFMENNKLSEAEYILKILSDGGYNFNRQHLQPSLPEFYLARICEQKRDNQGAISYLERALRKNPGSPWVLSHLFALTGEPEYESKIHRYFDKIDAQFFLGKAFLDIGEFNESISYFSYVVEKLPQYRKGIIYLSIAQGAIGKYELAVNNYLEALRLNKDPVFREKEIIGIFKAFAEQNPQDEKAGELLTMVLRQYGHFEQ